MENPPILNRIQFGWFTILLSTIYFFTAAYQIFFFITSAQLKKYGINVLTFPLAFLFIGIGGIRIYCGYLFLGKSSDGNIIKFVFTLLCFFEISVGFIYGLALVEEVGLMGDIVVLLFVLYYVIAFLFFKKLFPHQIRGHNA